MRAQLRFPATVVAPEVALRASMCLLLLVVCGPSAAARSIPHPHRQPKRIVRTIEKLEGQWRQAELHADTAVMSSMLSDDYLGIYANGMLATKAETLAAFQDGRAHFTEIDTFDRKLRVFGTTVVVISKAKVAGTTDGENISGLYRYTRVYHRSSGVWKIVSFEASALHEHGHPH